MRAAFCLLLVLLAGNSVAENAANSAGDDAARNKTISLSEAQHAMRAGNYAEAYCILKPLAEAGDAEAQYNLGWMYSNGYGLAINNSLALEWWRRASDQNHHDASFAIAMLYNHGEGEVERDPQKALEYFLQAARSGNDDAVLIIRSMLIRDDKTIHARRRELIQQHASLFGPLMQVRVKRANVRAQPSLDAAIVARLEQGAEVVELDRKGKWSQVGVLDDGRVAWIYSSLLQVKPPEKVAPAEVEAPASATRLHYQQQGVTQEATVDEDLGITEDEDF